MSSGGTDVHLSEQIERKQKDKLRFSDDDRRRSKQVTEEMRLALKAYLTG